METSSTSNSTESPKRETRPHSPRTSAPPKLSITIRVHCIQANGRHQNSTLVLSPSKARGGIQIPNRFPSRSLPIMVDDDKSKRIHIQSNFITDAESLHEEVHFKNTGKSKIIDRIAPHSTTSSTTSTSNPVAIEIDGVENRTRQGSANTTTIDQDPRTAGYDTSQL